MKNGGNQSSGRVAHLSFFRDVARLDIDWSKLTHYETAATNGGPRFMHENFWIVSDRPESIQTDDRRRPHCANGPSCRWRDGWELWHWHGVPVPKRVITNPELFTAEEIRRETNSEVVRAIAERLGWERFLELLGAVTIDEWVDSATGLEYQLLDCEYRAGELQPRLLRMQSPALHDGTQPYFIEEVDPLLQTARAARKWQIQLSTDSAARYYRHGDKVVTYAQPGTLYWPTVDQCNTNPELTFEMEA